MDAEAYLRDRVDDQINWYDAKAQSNQKLFRRLRVAEIVAAALIPLLAGQTSDAHPSIAITMGALGALVRGESSSSVLGDVEGLLVDASPAVRITAAEVLGRYGSPTQVAAALDVLIAAATLEDNAVMVAVAALNAIDAIDHNAQPLAARLRALPTEHDKVSAKQASYVPSLVERILEGLGGDA